MRYLTTRPSKRLLASFVICLSAFSLTACSTNPATGKSQFTALMSPQQENQVGASEHQKIIQQFGEYQNASVQNYVRSIGSKVSANTERPDVQYKFYVLDTPMVNAFALPGGYIYVTRGLLSLANSEAELAGVIAHEIGHITGKHSAERYSTGTLTTLGAGILSAAIGSSGVSQALGVGKDLYLSSYSRGQENEADSLGIRYMSRGGYNPIAMSTFLASLQSNSELENALKGQGSGSGVSYFSTHPATSDRVNKTASEASSYGQGGTVGNDAHLNVVNGLTYGDSARQGIVRGNSFYHPEIGFTFSVPEGFYISNQPTQVIASSNSGAVIVFDMVAGEGSSDPMEYVKNIWMKNEKIEQPERITVNGMDGATVSFPGKVNNRDVTISLVVMRWSNNRFARFQIAIPQNAPAALIDNLKRSSYSLRHLTPEEKNSIKPYSISIITAKAGDTVSSLARRQPFNNLQEKRFRVINGLGASEQIVPGKRYKLITG